MDPTGVSNRVPLLFCTSPIGRIRPWERPAGLRWAEGGAKVTAQSAHAPLACPLKVLGSPPTLRQSKGQRTPQSQTPSQIYDFHGLGTQIDSLAKSPAPPMAEPIVVCCPLFLFGHIFCPIYQKI